VSDVERADVAAQLHDVEGRGIDGKIDAEALAAAGGQQRRQQLAVVFLRHRLMDEANATLVEQATVLVIGIDDDEPLLVIGEVALDQSSVPLPIEPKPIMTMGPSIRPCTGQVVIDLYSEVMGKCDGTGE